MPSTADVMADSAKEAMKLTRKYFVVELNYTEESLEELERVIDDYRVALPDGDRPETVLLMARVWGAYLGEVIRRRVGGEWIEADETPGEAAALQVGERTVQPILHVRRRLEEGKSHNVWEFYQSLGIGR
jgi:hypothetical protein